MEQAMQEQIEGAQHAKEQLAEMVKRYSNLYDGVIQPNGEPMRFRKNDSIRITTHFVYIGGVAVATSHGDVWQWLQPYTIVKSFSPLSPFAHLSPFGLHEAAEDHPWLTDSELLNPDDK
jgi:hypothetical protein